MAKYRVMVSGVSGSIVVDADSEEDAMEKAGEQPDAAWTFDWMDADIEAEKM